jgi:hypothetical protein
MPYGEDMDVSFDGDTVTIDRVTSDDPVLAELLAHTPPDQRHQVVLRILAVGARGLLTMGVGLDLHEIDERVRRSVEQATGTARAEVDRILAEARVALEASLDPDQRTSMLGKALSELTAWQQGFLGGVDPDRAGSHTGRMLEHLRGLLGPGGALEQRLAEALDLGADDSSLGRFSATVDRRLQEIRDLVAEGRGRREEADRGTAKGLTFEDDLEEHLRRAAAALPGAVVERTSTIGGDLPGDAMVGDFVIELASGVRIVIEAKNTRTIGLTGRDGILGELDRALVNRRADVAVCLSALDAFPREVGPLGMYGRRLLAVEDGDGMMTWVAVRWAAAMAEATRAGGDAVGPDLAVIDDLVQRIRQLGQVFSSNRRSLTEISGSVDRVRDSLDVLRRELTALIDDLAFELSRQPTDRTVLPIRRKAV